jgi:hypothetical protein
MLCREGLATVNVRRGITRLYICAGEIVYSK